MNVLKTNAYEPFVLKEEQYKQISSEERIKEALIQDDCIGFYAYENENKIGFALIREFAENQYFLWDFIIDYRYQGLGKGKEFLQLLIDLLKNEYSATIITTTYVYDNSIAKKLYERIGFIETDVINKDDIHEVNMKLTL